jgi:hypothetical protein
VPAIFMACLAAFPVGERYVDRAFGFQLEVPDGWERSEVESTPGSLQIVLTPPKRGDRIQLTLRAMPVSVLESPERARELAIESTQDKAEYTDPVSDTVRFGKREVPSFSVHAKSPGGILRVRQHYLAGNGAVFILQSVAPTREFDGLAASFQRDMCP